MIRRGKQGLAFGISRQLKLRQVATLDVLAPD
jgi:hypothetical protein